MIFPVKMTEHIFIAFFPCAKDNNLNIVLAKLIHNAVDKVKALLVRQP